MPKVKGILLVVILMLVFGSVNLVIAKTPVELELGILNSHRLGEWQQVVDAYNDAQNEVVVELLALSSEQFVIASASGTAPDVMMQDSAELREKVLEGLYTPLDSYAATDGITEDMFVPFAWQRTHFDGHLWAMPLSADVRGVWVNTELFDKGGVPRETIPIEDVDTLDVVARKLSVEDPDGGWSQLGFIPWEGNWFPLGWNWAFGGKLYDYATDTLTVDNEQLRAALRWEQQNYAARYSYDEISKMDLHKLFQNGRLAMRIDTNLSPAPTEFEYDVMPVPHGPGAKTTSWSGMWGIVLPKESEHKKEGWDLIRWLTGPEGQTVWAIASREIPTVREPEDAYYKLDNEYNEKFFKLLYVTHGEPTFPEYFSLLWALVDAEKKVLTFQKPPEEVLRDLQARYEAMIKERLKRSR